MFGVVVLMKLLEQAFNASCFATQAQKDWREVVQY